MSQSLKDKKISTQVSHAGRQPKEHHGAVSTPPYRTSTIMFDSLAALEDKNTRYVYGRRGTPSSESFAEAINLLEGGSRTFLTPSGLSAITVGLLSVLRAGDHLLMTDSAYNPTRQFCDRTLKRMGVETTYYDPRIGSGIAALMRPNTRAVFCESPGSLTFEMQDIPAIAEKAHAHGASVLMDNTWATPLYFQPLAHGVDLSITSVTKYIAGHSDLMMGYICTNAAHAERVDDTHGDLGQFSAADDIFLALRGLRTLPVRLKRHEENALEVALWLARRPEVARVLHPALRSDPGHDIFHRDYRGSCGLFALELKPVTDAALATFMDGLELFGIGWSWGGFESLITPCHINRSTGSFHADGPVVRLHIGLEESDDLIADLKQGFEKMARAR